MSAEPAHVVVLGTCRRTDPLGADDFDTYFETVSSLAGPLAMALSAAAPEQLQGVRQSAADLTQRYACEDGLVLPGRALVAIAS